MVSILLIGVFKMEGMMGIDLSKKRIIMIHGLASKPPEETLHDLWSRCIIENIRVDDPELAGELEKHEKVFRSAYWADATPHHIADDDDYVDKLRVQVDNVIDARKKTKEFHVGFGEAAADYFKDKGADLVKIFASALTVKDDVMKMFLSETKLYDEDQYIADKMREHLETELRDAWDNDCDVALIAHSMGTFISYDVLWQFSHRNVEEFEGYNDRKVQLFVTMGSPLGDSTIRDLLFARHHKNKGDRQFPTNIDFWHNYSCLGDVVSHHDIFKDVFFKPMRELGIFPHGPEHRAIDYAKLHNPFEVVSHKGNEGKEKRNPHKSYGYLVQPRLNTWLADFLKGELQY